MLYQALSSSNQVLSFESYIFEYIHSSDSLSCAPFAQLQPEQKRRVDTIAIGDYHKKYHPLDECVAPLSFAI